MLETRPCLRTAGVCDQTASPLPPGRTSSPRLSPQFTLRGAHGERAAGIPRRGADKEHRGESVQEPPVTSQMRGPTKPCLLSGTACLSARGTGNRAALCIFLVKLFSQRSVYRLKPLSASLASDNGQGTARHGTAPRCHLQLSLRKESKRAIPSKSTAQTRIIKQQARLFLTSTKKLIRRYLTGWFFGWFCWFFFLRKLKLSGTSEANSEST